MLKNITAVIPVRKNSQRVINKNLRLFNKKNLLIYKIEKLKQIKYIDQIIINTDSEEAIKIAKDLNVGFWRREDYYASSICTNSEFWSHIADTTDSKFIMFTNCTSPLVKIETYNNIFKKFEEIKNINDSLNTVTEEKNFLYMDNKAINFDPIKAPNSQDLPNIVKLNFAVNILSKKLMLTKKV
jgi:CMP-N-acetylneuraminic acid synthetase